MTVAAGPFAIAAILLVLGGLLKALRPGDTARALETAGIPLARPLTVRVGGMLEAGVGAWALVTSDRWSALAVGTSYAVFAGFVVVALARGLAIASCGCFGKADTPPSLVHVAVNVAAVIAASAVAIDPGAGLVDILTDQPLAGVGFVLVIVTGVLLTFAALTELPKVWTPRISTRGEAGA